MKPLDGGLMLLKVAALTVLLLVGNGIGSRFLPAANQEPGVAAPPAGWFMALVVAVMALQAIALAYPTVGSRWNGWKLTVAVFLLYFGTTTFQGQIESLVYIEDKMPEGMLVGLFAMGLFAAAVFAPLAVLVLGRWRAPGLEQSEADHREPTSVGEWAWKSVVGGMVFLALYYLFGYFVAWKNPTVREYYGGTDPGSFLAQMGGIARDAPWMLAFQFVRGLLWVALAVLVIRMMKGAWWEVGIAVSLLFTVPAAYLLFPNPLMPEAVRMIHLVETAPYQFLFGWFIVWLFCRHAARGRAAQPG